MCSVLVSPYMLYPPSREQLKERMGIWMEIEQTRLKARVAEARVPVA